MSPVTSKAKAVPKIPPALLYSFQPQHPINTPDATHLSTCSIFALFTLLYTNAPDVMRANVQSAYSFHNRTSSYKSARRIPTLTYPSVHIFFHSCARRITRLNRYYTSILTLVFNSLQDQTITRRGLPGSASISQSVDFF